MTDKPVLINTHEFIRQSLEVHGKIRASQIPTIQDSLFVNQGAIPDAGEVEYTLSGDKEYLGKLSLRLVLTGKIKLCCQRCLGEMAHLVASSTRFELVADESVMPELDEDDEVDYLVASTEFDVGALVVEELLLCLPLAPRHEEGGCIGVADDIKGQKPNPFQVLEGLKKPVS
ncbi:MAG: YceD family protein [Methylophilaceae bacterium]